MILSLIAIDGEDGPGSVDPYIGIGVVQKRRDPPQILAREKGHQTLERVVGRCRILSFDELFQTSTPRPGVVQGGREELSRCEHDGGNLVVPPDTIGELDQVLRGRRRNSKPSSDVGGTKLSDFVFRIQIFRSGLAEVCGEKSACRERPINETHFPFFGGEPLRFQRGDELRRRYWAGLCETFDRVQAVGRPGCHGDVNDPAYPGASCRLGRGGPGQGFKP